MLPDSTEKILKVYRDSLPGLRTSAVLLVCSGAVFGAYSGLFGVLLAFSVFRSLSSHPSGLSDHHFRLGILLIAVLCGTLAYLCFRAAPALHDGKQWAAYLAILIGASYLGLSGNVVHDWFHPERQIPDEAFGLLLVPVLTVVGLWWCIYLNLPHVRAHMKSLRGC